MVQRKKYTPYVVWFDAENPEEMSLMRKLEEARKIKGMTRKGFVLYGVANLVPELAPVIMDVLLNKPRSGNRKAVLKDVDEALHDAK